METRTEVMDDFNRDFETLIENIYSEVRFIELEELQIPPGAISPLSKILSEIPISGIEMSAMREISDSRVQKEKVISLLTYEMKFLNSKYPHLDGDEIRKMKPNKWWLSVDVVLNSIASYINIPYLDIIQEIAKLCSIIVGADSEQKNI